jgi:hypothetical protein
MQREWLDLVAREGTVGQVQARAAGAAAAMNDDPDAEPPCPACGTAAPLVDGECSGCGLYLGE